MKERISLTLGSELLSDVDRMVDGVRVRNRSHAIEMLLLKALENNHLTQALILAGGEGTRLRPLTYEIPKPLIPVKGKPMLEHTIRHLKKYGVEDILLSVGHLSERVISYFGNGEKWGISIRYIRENEKMGTAGPLKIAEPMLNKNFLMLNGDVLSKIDLADLNHFHRQNSGLATIALVAVENPSHYGVVEIKGNQITGFLEKPKNPPSNLINAGIYLLDKEVLNYVPQGPAMMEKDVFPKLAREGKMFGYTYSGPWFDVGTHERLEKAIKEWEP